MWEVARSDRHDKIGMTRQMTLQSAHFGDHSSSAKEINMLWTIFVVLVILWLLGFTLHVAGGLIHLLLVIALVVLVINLVSGRRMV
jgi:Flp pilus assembly protein TadB